MEPNVKLQAKKSQEYNFNTNYAALIGSINYCPLQPDPTLPMQPINVLNIHKIPHWEAAK
jgi:hypothetical protein